MAPPKAEEKKKILVPRKKLQSVPDLLVNGDKDISETESTTAKLLWMFFLVVMFYVSFEFLLIHMKRNDGEGGEGGSASGGKSEF
mmetsp:Transcript_22046/g.47950  ORF Transcript_22046/g.47950 Transcript_22046/m.47950 type:complete len:85 (-) Transcript_22046:413-667(-)|eukprot:CAMPEP_0172320376 /NCGR_PEP_ID=MMETSP1058-20130122/40439_1 /TAXON_ID=83371 /ORGANISM="Detonula confervacea, Strain CCMP 353" /LENGTH=84 /DNA_ID=CAMNT_0013035635 /DNA_START=184 /DNA_END=438 /DNA_ORIENTATION=+